MYNLLCIFLQVFWHLFCHSCLGGTQDGPSGFLMCLRMCGHGYLLEPALEKLNWCRIFLATVMPDYKMKEVLIALPTCLARFPPQLSKELANIRQDSQPVFLLFSNSCNIILHKASIHYLFSYVLLKFGK